jgi:hypothetical protein
VKVRVKDREWPVCAKTVATIAPGLSTSFADLDAPASIAADASLGNGVAVLGLLAAIWVAGSMLVVLASRHVRRRDPRDATAWTKAPRARNLRPP